MGPIEKTKVKVNLYDPHSEPLKESMPGPCDYFGGIPHKRVKTANRVNRNATIRTQTSHRGRRAKHGNPNDEDSYASNKPNW